jgi:hypothetical protein
LLRIVPNCADRLEKFATQAEESEDFGKALAIKAMMSGQAGKASALIHEASSLPDVAGRLANCLRGEILSELRTLPADRTAKSTGRPTNANDPRDKFIYEQMEKGKNLTWIKNRVNRKKSWQHLDTDQAVSAAARRYALRNALPWPINT